MRPDHFNQNRSKEPPNYEMQVLLRYNVATLSAGHAYPEHCTVWSFTSLFVSCVFCDTPKWNKVCNRKQSFAIRSYFWANYYILFESIFSLVVLQILNHCYLFTCLLNWFFPLLWSISGLPTSSQSLKLLGSFGWCMKPNILIGLEYHSFINPHKKIESCFIDAWHSLYGHFTS